MTNDKQESADKIVGSTDGLGCNTGRLGCCIREAEEFEAVRVEPVVGHKDLPGGLALALAVQKGEWPHTMDAQTWATAWMLQLKETPEIYKDEGAMICWFANAIMAGYDTAMLRCTVPNAKLTGGPSGPSG